MLGVRCALPVALTHDATWLLVEAGFNAAREREIESIFAIGNGYVGSRGSLEEGGALSTPATFIAGVFETQVGSDSVPRLAVAPDWARFTASINGRVLALDQGEIIEHRRILDLRQGLLWRVWRQRDPDGRIISFQSLRLVSRADRHTLFQSVTLIPENFTGRLNLIPPAQEEADVTGIPTLHTEQSGIDVAFAVAADIHPPCSEAGRTIETRCCLLERHEIEIEMDQAYRFDRFVAVATSRDTARPAGAATEQLRRLCGRGAGPLLADHLAAWRERWRTADLQLTGDDYAQRALRFACYHLISASNSDDRTSIGARALTGPAYSGHVFWDTEIYMLPFYLYTHPPTARALLMYRYHTLPAAREKARTYGYRGAFYPWETAGDGTESTPQRVLALDGTVHTIRNGELEVHVSAAIPYAVWQYWIATGNDAFLRDAGAEILIETARFWASRGQLEDDGHFHIRHVIGPDEYHEDVDDDAFTNGMAAWNLEHAAVAARILAKRWPEHWQALQNRLALGRTEPDEWSRFANAMYQGLDPRTGIIEQFQGYHSLEEIDLAAYEPLVAPMDVILGPERIQRSQIIKQPDVLMLIYLLWDRFHPDIRRANFYHYEPRTGHGSSLSPCIHALLAARLGETELAERYFRQAAEIDLADNMGNAAGGVHVGALGGLWQATVFGFGGMHIGPKGPAFAPHLPRAWQELRFPIHWRGSTLRIVVDTTGATVLPDEPNEPVE
jgi:kojibiose phosphorylase